MTDEDEMDMGGIYAMLDELERFRKERKVISSQELGDTLLWKHLIRRDGLMSAKADDDTGDLAGMDAHHGTGRDPENPGAVVPDRRDAILADGALACAREGNVRADEPRGIIVFERILTLDKNGGSKDVPVAVLKVRKTPHPASRHVKMSTPGGHGRHRALGVRAGSDPRNLRCRPKKQRRRPFRNPCTCPISCSYRNPAPYPSLDITARDSSHFPHGIGPRHTE